MCWSGPPPLYNPRHPAPGPRGAPPTAFPDVAAMSSARCPAWKYWLIDPPLTGQTSDPGAPAGCGAVTAGAPRPTRGAGVSGGRGAGVAATTSMGAADSVGRTPRLGIWSSTLGLGTRSALNWAATVGSLAPARAVPTRSKKGRAAGAGIAEVPPPRVTASPKPALRTTSARTVRWAVARARTRVSTRRRQCRRESCNRTGSRELVRSEDTRDTGCALRSPALRRDRNRTGRSYQVRVEPTTLSCTRRYRCPRSFGFRLSRPASPAEAPASRGRRDARRRPRDRSRPRSGCRRAR